jgi:hypothetical protein
MRICKAALNLYINAICDGTDDELVAAGEKLVGLIDNAFNFRFDHDRFYLHKEKIKCKLRYHQGIINKIKGVAYVESKSS